MQNRLSSPALVGYLAGLLLAGCSGTHESGQAAVRPTPRLAAPPATNVPALVGMSIDKLSERLGPSQHLPPDLANSLEGVVSAANLNRQDSLASFRTGGLTLLASYDVRTRQVRDLLLLGQREDSLMAQGTLRASARDYLVLPIFRVNKPGRLVGLRIIALK